MAMSKLKKALERAKETRKEEDRFAEETPFRGDIEQAFPAIADERERPERGDIRPVYMRTKVVEADPRRLRRNKVVSLFPENLMADQIKILRTQILKKMEELEGNSLLVTSSKPREGKTVTAINLAVSISLELDRTVMLVDADLRTPAVHRYLGFDSEGGLSDYLVHRTDIGNFMISPGIEKLTVLPAGKPLPNSSELLGAPRMESLVREMKARYAERFLIFDSPSLLTFADPLAFSRFIDGVLFVVEAEKSTRRDLKRSLDLLKGKPLVGTVLNKVRG
jgi:protein-tyrosine kinase